MDSDSDSEVRESLRLKPNSRNPPGVTPPNAHWPGELVYVRFRPSAVLYFLFARCPFTPFLRPPPFPLLLPILSTPSPLRPHCSYGALSCWSCAVSAAVCQDPSITCSARDLSQPPVTQRKPLRRIRTSTLTPHILGRNALFLRLEVSERTFGKSSVLMKAMLVPIGYDHIIPPSCRPKLCRRRRKPCQPCRHLQQRNRHLWPRCLHKWM